MSSTTGTLVVVEDDQDACDLLARALKREGFAVTAFTSPQAAVAFVAEQPVDVIISDISMAGMDGIELCEHARRLQPDLPVILVTAHGSMQIAIRALRAEAFDFVPKPVEMGELVMRVRRAIELRGVKREIDRLQRERGSTSPVANLVGTSASMRRVYGLVRRVSESDASVLIYGETGTGKELVAQAIHQESARRKGPLVAINCAAVPASLIESHLFGHAKGAFTDAKESKRGLFLEAEGGTLFLDEIGEMPLEVQPKLLRALQERTVRPIGANQETAFDVRIVAATNRDLESEVAEKRFREDLYYRLNVVTIDLPPLRARGADVLAIARLLLERLAPRRNIEISPGVGEKLMSYDWPGNVRELENCIERALALSLGDTIALADLPDKVRDFVPQSIVMAAREVEELISIDELERRYIEKVIQKLGGNKSRAAEVLGVDRRTLYRRLETWNRKRDGSTQA